MKLVLSAVSLIFLFLLNTTLGFSFWQVQADLELSSMFSTRSNAAMIVQPVATENNARLVPYGALKGQNDVDEIVYVYTIDLNDDELVDITKLYLEVKNCQEKLRADDYFTTLIDVDYHELNDGSRQAWITVTIRLEPVCITLLQSLTGVNVTLFIDYVCC